MNLNQVTLPSTDIRRSVEFYRRMGFTLIVDSPEYVRFECPVGAATFSLHRVDETEKGRNTIVYFESNDLDHLVDRLKASGIVFDHEPRDESWLWREARLQDPDGNLLCLYYAGDNRRHPPWRVGAS